MTRPSLKRTWRHEWRRFWVAGIPMPAKRTFQIQVWGLFGRAWVLGYRRKDEE